MRRRYQPPPIPSSSSSSSDDNTNNDNDNDEDGAMGGDVFEGGVRLSREEDGGRDEIKAEAFRNLNMIDPRRKKTK